MAPASSALIVLATYFAPWMAPCATPGTPSTAAISPTTNTFGYPGMDRSGSTWTRPARSSSTRDCSARSLPNRLAETPADQTLQADSMRRTVPSESLTVMPLRSTSVTIAPSWISTPSFCNRPSTCARPARRSVRPFQHRWGQPRQR
ncbi:Uncharacterised protein [Mycobacterium tuberculosis]|nr:Uncharacterised protein [Mycobacterium tuberculosis]